jgi:hypothetical protein
MALLAIISPYDTKATSILSPRGDLMVAPNRWHLAMKQPIVTGRVAGMKPYITEIISTISQAAGSIIRTVITGTTTAHSR